MAVCGCEEKVGSVVCQKHDYDYDLVIIGGGSGGLSCAKQAAALGAKVAVLDFVTPSPRGSSWGLGGTCVNVGCIPKKLMHEAALLSEAFEDAKHYGWNIPDKSKICINWAVLREEVQNIIKATNWVARVQLRENNIDYINGKAYFVNCHTVNAVMKNGEERKITGSNFLIATGTRPVYPEVPGAVEFGITSDDLFSLENGPGETLIVGAGYIGVECAGFLQSLGYQSTVMARSVVLREFDQQMAGLVKNQMLAGGVKFLTKCQTTKVQKEQNGKLSVTYKNTDSGEEKVELFDTVMFATGRAVLPTDLCVDAAGVKTHKSGKIIVENEQTNIPNIYAVGDVLHDKPELTPVAIHAGKLLAMRLYGNSKLQMDYENVATTVFSPLEYSCVGLSEEKAIHKHGEDKIEVYHTFYKPYEFLIPQRSIENCYIKVITYLKPPQKVLGMHIVGRHTGEIIQGFSTAMKCGLTMEQLIATIGIHPTTAEEFNRLYITKRSKIDPMPQACCS